MATTIDEINALLAGMPTHDQERVLWYARMLANPPQFPHTPLPPGTPGRVIAQLRVSPEVGEALAEALEDTERIYPDE